MGTHQVERIILFVAMVVLGLFLTTGHVVGYNPRQELCEVAALNVNLKTADGQQVRVDFPQIEPLEVKAATPLSITVEIVPKPTPCAGDFAIDWKLWFVVGPSQISVITESPTQTTFNMIVSAHPSEALEEDFLEITVRDPRQRQHTELLRFKVK